MLKNDFVVHVRLKVMNFYSFQFISWPAYILCHLYKFVFTISVLMLAVLFLFIFIHYQVPLTHYVIIAISPKRGRIFFFLTFFKYRVYHAKIIRYFYHPRLFIVCLVFQLVLIAVEFQTLNT
jgi:hypothetical protein